MEDETVARRAVDRARPRRWEAGWVTGPFWLVALLCACADPALAPLREGLESYDAGRAALTEDRPKEAAEAFVVARRVDPASSALALWEAKARADAGELTEADVILTTLVRAQPQLGEAWYNRAAYRARAGRMSDSAADLSHALALNVRSPLEAAADPDFEAARADPAFMSLLPAQPLEASVRGADTLFVGSRYPLVFTIVALPTASIRVTRAGADPGCLRPMRVVQDDHVEAGKVTSTLTIELRAEGPCDATLGPFEVRAGAAVIAIEPVVVRVEAPPDHAIASAVVPTNFPLPSAYAATDAGFRAVRDEGVLAMGRPGSSFEAEGGRRPDVALEWRVEAQTRAVGGWWWGSEPLTVRAGEWSVAVP